MPSFSPQIARPVVIPTPLVRAISIAALMGATILTGPLTAAPAQAAQVLLAQAAAPQSQSASPAAPATPVSPAAPTTQATPPAQTGDTAATPPPNTNDTTAEAKQETVDQRITSLHDALQITPQEEPKWDRVARVMRDNAAAMQKLIAERDAQAPNITAVQDLQEYEKFTQAHVTGLRKLTVSFDTLYKSMPPAQQKIADEVFQNFGHHPGAAAHS
jgi:protein CpxP